MGFFEESKYFKEHLLTAIWKKEQLGGIATFYFASTVPSNKLFIKEPVMLDISLKTYTKFLDTYFVIYVTSL